MRTGRSVRIVGDGRAGGSLAAALSGTGWTIAGPVGRDGDVPGAAGRQPLPAPVPSP